MEEAKIIEIQEKHLRTIQQDFRFDLSDFNEYNSHANLIAGIANNYLSAENRKFIVDDSNKKILRFLTYYFNGCSLCVKVFPDERYELHKNILLIGSAGTGKTLLMQIFSDYLKYTRNPLYFKNISVTQILNTQRNSGNIDKYIYNEQNSSNFEGSPYHVCLNDIGIEREYEQKSFGTDLKNVIDDFLFARYEIYQQQGVRYHLTSNLSVKDFKENYKFRLFDRFKSFNVLVLGGGSRR